MHLRVAAAVRPLLEAQHGVVTTAQLRAAGLDRRIAHRAGWVRLTAHIWSSREVADAQLLQTASLLQALPSGALACRTWALRDAPTSVVGDVLVRHGRRTSGGPLVRVHQTSRLPAPQQVRGWGLAPVERAVADACRWSTDLAEVRALVLAAVADGRARADRLEAERLHRRHGDAALLTRALRDVARGAASAPEAEAADALLARRDVPPFLLNPVLSLRGGFLGRPDGYVPGLGIGWEIDSVRHHGSASDLAATLHRHTAFGDAGVLLVHVVPAVLRADPAGWAADFAAQVASRVSAGAQDPDGLAVIGDRRPLAA